MSTPLGQQCAGQHHVKEVDSGTTPDRDANNAISQRQGATGGFVALQAAGPEAGTSVRLYAHDIAAYLPGDVEGDALLSCADLAVASGAVGKRSVQRASCSRRTWTRTARSTCATSRRSRGCCRRARAASERGGSVSSTSLPMLARRRPKRCGARRASGLRQPAGRPATGCTAGVGAE